MVNQHEYTITPLGELALTQRIQPKIPKPKHYYKKRNTCFHCGTLCYCKPQGQCQACKKRKGSMSGGRVGRWIKYAHTRR